MSEWGETDQVDGAKVVSQVVANVKPVTLEVHSELSADSSNIKSHTRRLEDCWGTPLR